VPEGADDAGSGPPGPSPETSRPEVSDAPEPEEAGTAPAPASRGGPGMVAGCLAFAVLSLALVGGTIFALVVALGGSSPGPVATTRPAGATSGHRADPGASGSVRRTTPTTGRGPTTTTVPAAVGPGSVPTLTPTTNAPVVATPTSVPSPITSNPSSSSGPLEGLQAGTACVADEVGVTVRLDDGSLIRCVASGSTSQWVAVSG
jgi:hypothetical protein